MEEIKKQVEMLKEKMDEEVQRIEADKAQLEKERDDFERRKEQIAKVHFPNNIKLDVGGRVFKTSLATLQKEDSMLSSMFSGRGFKVEKDVDGCYFIDRPGAPFEVILNYLQTDHFIEPSDIQLLKAVKVEADFYQIGSLLKRLTVRQFEFKNINSNSGIIDWIGRDFGNGKNFANPVDSGKVAISGYGTNANRCAVEKNQGDAGCCTDARNRYFDVDLKTVRIKPSSYTLSYSNTCHRPSNWSVSGSSDGNNWTVLKAHVNDRSLENQNTAHWKLDCDQEYSRFRVMCTGYDLASTGCFCFHVCGLEIYGESMM